MTYLLRYKFDPLGPNLSQIKYVIIQNNLQIRLCVGVPAVPQTLGGRVRFLPQSPYIYLPY